nr:MAG TPA: hypothetical protein [Caudoviricetes sp.]
MMKNAYLLLTIIIILHITEHVNSFFNLNKKFSHSLYHPR